MQSALASMMALMNGMILSPSSNTSPAMDQFRSAFAPRTSAVMSWDPAGACNLREAVLKNDVDLPLDNASNCVPLPGTGRLENIVEPACMKKSSEVMSASDATESQTVSQNCDAESDPQPAPVFCRCLSLCSKCSGAMLDMESRILLQIDDAERRLEEKIAEEMSKMEVRICRRFDEVLSRLGRTMSIDEKGASEKINSLDLD